MKTKPAPAQLNMFDQIVEEPTIDYSLLLREHRNTGISWATDTQNPSTGCEHVDGDCDHCYAESLSLRRGWSRKPWTHQHAAENVKLHPDRIKKTKKFRPGAVVFVDSMSDLFHHLIPDSFIQLVFDAMRSRPDVLFLILTKRPARAIKWQDWPPNVWLGTSCGHQGAIHRVRQLRKCQAAMLFLSIEPMWGPVNLHGELNKGAGRPISWVIVGGESGAPAKGDDPGWRQMDHAWARDVRDACQEQGAAFFFKQSAAPRTEMGTSLMEPCARCGGTGVYEDDHEWSEELREWICLECQGRGYRRWIWHQYPGHLVDPVEDRTPWPAYYTPGNMSAKATRLTP